MHIAHRSHVLFVVLAVVFSTVVALVSITGSAWAANPVVSPAVDSLLMGAGDVRGRVGSTTRLDLQSPAQTVLCPNTFFGECSPAATMMTRWVKKGQSVVLKYTNTSTKNSCLSSDANAARITPYDFGPDPRVMTHYRVEFKLYCGTRGEAFGNGPDTQLYFVDKAPRYDYMLSANDVMDIAQQFRTDARYRAKVCNLATMVETVDKIFDYVGLGKALGEGLLKATQEFAKMKGIDLLKEPAAGSTDNCEGARRLAAAAAATPIQYGAMLSGNIG